MAHPVLRVGVLLPHSRPRGAREPRRADRWEFGAGAAFVVPAGFEGTWEVIEDCTKFYAIFEART